MADNVTLDAGSGGDTIAADDISSVKYQRIKLIHGADGTNDGDVSTANPFPIRTYFGTTAASVGAGAVGTGVQRMTLASDDPAVALLTTMDVDTGGIATSAASIDGKITACNTGAVVVSSSALPSGAATAAKQPALGTAGTASADVITVQGITSMTPLLATLSGTNNIATVTTVTTVSAVTGITNALPSGDNNIGNVDIVTVPSDPFGVNADAASATGSISAKLRFIASTGIPITGTVTVGSHAVTNAGTFAVQVDGAALTRLTDIETNTDSCAVVGNGAAATAQRVTIANDSTGTVAVTGSVTANAGTNLNTSALALESGGNLAAAATSLAAIDDWDESDRAKVNPIVGQAGVAGGNGAVTATTQRVAIADLSVGDYETVAAGQTDQTLGATGATGDYLAGVLIVPATTSPGAVSIKDGAGSAITIFTGGASSVSNLVPFFVPLGIISAAGAWKVTTGSNVSAIGVGNFA